MAAGISPGPRIVTSGLPLFTFSRSVLFIKQPRGEDYTLTGRVSCVPPVQASHPTFTPSYAATRSLLTTLLCVLVFSDLCCRGGPRAVMPLEFVMNMKKMNCFLNFLFMKQNHFLVQCNFSFKLTNLTEAHFLKEDLTNSTLRNYVTRYFHE